MMAIVSIYPASADRLYLLGEGIDDPYGGNLEMYRRCRDKIQAALPGVLKVLEEPADA